MYVVARHRTQIDQKEPESVLTQCWNLHRGFSKHTLLAIPVESSCSGFFDDSEREGGGTPLASMSPSVVLPRNPRADEPIIEGIASSRVGKVQSKTSKLLPNVEVHPRYLAGSVVRVTNNVPAASRRHQ